MVQITEGLVRVATIVFWNDALDWITYRMPSLGRWIEPPPLPLIRGGELLRQNLRKELISIDELEPSSKLSVLTSGTSSRS